MRSRQILSFGNFFGSAHFFLLFYVLAPYLATLMPASHTGLVVSLGAVITLSIFPFIPRIVARFGPQRVALVLASVEAVVLLCLALQPTILVAILCGALACAGSPLIAYQLDLLLEATVKDEGNTGRIRTAFLTAGNIALVVTPLIIGTLLDGSDRYERVFYVAAVSLVPFILILFGARLPQGNIHLSHNLRDACQCIAADPDLRAIAASMFLLQLFYHLGLYIPLYLHTALGFPWSDLGWVFAVMLVPFVLVEYPAGILADTKLGDRTLLIAGFAITGTAFALIAAIMEGTSIFLVLIVLVLTRIGAALVEAMAEGHFFRRVSEEDTNTVSVFRMMRPLAALTAPLIGSFFLIVSGYQMLFVSMGLIIAIAGMMAATAVRNFRSSRSVLHADANRV